MALIVYYSSCFFSWLTGKKDERIEDAEQTIKEIEKTNNAINRAHNNSDIATKLYERYNLDK